MRGEAIEGENGSHVHQVGYRQKSIMRMVCVTGDMELMNILLENGHDRLLFEHVSSPFSSHVTPPFGSSHQKATVSMGKLNLLIGPPVLTSSPGRRERGPQHFTEQHEDRHPLRGEALKTTEG